MYNFKTPSLHKQYTFIKTQKWTLRSHYNRFYQTTKCGVLWTTIDFTLRLAYMMPFLL